MKNEGISDNKLSMLLAILAGVFGMTAAGAALTGPGAEQLPQLAALAVPGLLAWVISYLSFRQPGEGENTPLALPAEEESLLPLLAETVNAFEIEPMESEEFAYGTV